MCQGDDRGCPEFEHHRRLLLADLGHERRAFLKSAVATMGGIGAAAGGLSLVTPAMAQAAAAAQPAKRGYHYLPATAETVHWGYFSKLLKPQVEVESGDLVTIEVLTHHANDDAERMIKGDPGCRERVLLDQGAEEREPPRRRPDGRLDPSAAAPARASACTSAPARSMCAGPSPATCWRSASWTRWSRPSANPEFAGKAFGSNAAAWWGYHYNDLLTEPKPREVITIYEVDATGERNWAKAVYNFHWTPQTDPFGVVHKIIDYPGVPVDHATIKRELRHPQERARADPAAFRRGGPGAARGRHGRFDPARLLRRQHRQLAHRQGCDDVLPGGGRGRAALGRRLPRLAGRFRAVRHGDRMLAHRHLPAHPAQEGVTRRHRARGPRLPDAGDQGRFRRPRLHLRQLPGRARRRRRSRRSTASPRSTVRCATPSARCASS